MKHWDLEDFFIYTNPFFWVYRVYVNVRKVAALLITFVRVIIFPYGRKIKKFPPTKIERFKKALENDVKNNKTFLRYAFRITLKAVNKRY